MEFRELSATEIRSLMLEMELDAQTCRHRASLSALAAKIALDDRAEQSERWVARLQTVLDMIGM